MNHLRAKAGRRRVHPSGDDVRNGAGHRHPLDLRAYRHRVHRDAVDEVHRAVDGIEHPGDRVVGRGPRIPSADGPAALLPENRVTRPHLGQPIPQQPFRLGVDHGHRVGRGALRPHGATAGGTGVGPEHFGAAAPHKVGGLGGQGFGHGAQPRGLVVGSRHPSIASQSSPAARTRPTATVRGPRRIRWADSPCLPRGFDDQHRLDHGCTQHRHDRWRAAASCVRHRRRRQRHQGRHRRPDNRAADRRAEEAADPAASHPVGGRQDHRRGGQRVRVDRSARGDLSRRGHPRRRPDGGQRGQIVDRDQRARHHQRRAERPGRSRSSTMPTRPGSPRSATARARTSPVWWCC